jgi:drug/metabolite transporter (DMT)-like permease
VTYFLITLVLFSSLEVASKPLMDVVAPLELTFLRFLAGWLTLVVMLLPGRGRRELFSLTPRDWARLAFLGVLNVSVSMTLLQAAVMHTTAATAAAVFCSNPLFVYLISVAWGDERANPRAILGLAAGIGGLLLVTSSGGLRLDRGIVFALLSSLSFAIYTILSRHALRRMSPLCLNAGSFAFGIVAIGAFLLLTGRSISVPAGIAGDPGALASLLYLGVCVSGVGYVTFMKTVECLSATRASLVFMLKPATATILAMLFLRESPGALFYPGAALVLAGSVLITGSGMRRRTA